jgi:hypothetical protein
MRVALVSSCTNRKKLPPPSELQARNLAESSLPALAHEWSRRLSEANRTLSVRDLYGGRAFTEAIAASKAANADFFIISAGLGLVAIDERVPSYSLTVAGSDADNILRKVRDFPGRPKHWWTALNRSLGRGAPLARLVEEHNDQLFVFALPSTYLEMVSEDLEALSAASIKRLRIIGLPTLKKFIPAQLVENLIAYDERLEAPDSSMSGTRSDFPQRAARHFITSVLADPNAAAESATEHAARVSRFLTQFSRPEIPNRERHTDAVLKNVIRGMWGDSQGRVTSGLKLLRRERGIACEQARFKRLFWEVAAEKGVHR